MAVDKQLVLKTLSQELTKTRIVLDGQSRAQFMYQAPYNAKDGDPCLRTEYLYASPTSAIIVGMKETETPWQSAFDADFTT